MRTPWQGGRWWDSMSEQMGIKKYSLASRPLRTLAPMPLSSNTLPARTPLASTVPPSHGSCILLLPWKLFHLFLGSPSTKSSNLKVTESSTHWGSCYLLPHVQGGGGEPGAKGHAPSPVQEREGCQSTMRQGDIWPLHPKQRGFLGHNHLIEVTIRVKAPGQGKLEEILLNLVSGSVGSTKGVLGEGRVD